MHQRFTSALAITLALAIWIAAPTAHAVPLLTGFGGPGGYGTGVLPGNDDGSSSVIDLTSAFPGGLLFFGGPYTSFYVNNNGNITFSGALGTYTPNAFPVASRPMIAPYWADVDTRGGGAPTNNGVYWHLEPGRLIVTWHNVGYYNTHDNLKMDFQLVITNALDCRSGDFNVEFRFNRCEWETGDASGGSGGFGGTPAQAGFDAGNGTDFVEIMGSRMPGIAAHLCADSNVSMPGIWQFGVRGGMVSCPGTGEICDTGMPGACGVGITQCVGRAEVCAQIGTMSTERCDGVDNDCNGSVDDGNLCAATETCWQGRCIPLCFEGGCVDGESCNSDGHCVETACVDVTCAPGERCSGGACLGACEGISCPHGQQCIAGRCTDLCDVLTCESGEICVDGACVAQCPCRACAADEICGGDGACIPLGCDVVICDPGFYCSGGACLDACAGAVCPEGQICQAGDCVDGTPPEADAGPRPEYDGGGGGEVDSGGGGEFDGGTGEVDAGRRPPRTDGGCGCAVPQRRPLPVWALALAALGLFLGWRRRR